MKLIFKIICGTLIFICSHLSAQNLVPHKDTISSLYGYLNEGSNKWEISPAFDTVCCFYFNHAVVSKDGKFGLIDAKGRFTINPQFEELEGEQLYVFRKGDTSGMVDCSGRMFFKGIYSYIYFDPKRGSALIKDDNLYGYWDTTNSFIPPFSIFEIMFKNGLAYFNTGYSLGFINTKGERVLEIKEGKVWEVEGKGFIVSEGGKEKFYDSNGKLHGQFDSIIQVKSNYIVYLKESKVGLLPYNSGINSLDEFQAVTPFNSRGVAIAKKDDFYGVIDSLLQTVIPFEYQYIQDLGKEYNRLNNIYKKPNKFALIKQNNLYGVLTEAGEILLPPQFKYAYVEEEILVYMESNKILIRDLLKDRNIPISDIFIFNKDHAIYFFEEDGRSVFGLIDKSGKVIVPPVYKSIESLYNGLFIAEDGSGVGLLDTSGIPLVPLVNKGLFILNDLIQAKSIGNIIFDNYIYTLTHSGKVGAFDRNGKLIVDTVWNNISAFDEDGESFFVQDKSGRWRLVAKSGKFSRATFDAPVLFYENRAVICKNNNYGVINDKGENIVGFKYEQILPQRNKTYFFRKGSSWGLLSYEGKALSHKKFSFVSGFIGEYAFVKKKKTWGVINKDGVYFKGYEKLQVNFKEQTETSIQKASFSFSTMKDFDEISFELFVDSVALKPFQTWVNDYILDLIEEKMNVAAKEPAPVLVIRDSTVSQREEYIGQGIELLSATETTASINFFSERSGRGYNSVEEREKVLIEEGGGLKEIQLKDLFLDTDYTSFLNEIIASRLRETDVRAKPSLKGDIILFDADKFQLDKKGLVLKVNNRIYDFTTYDFFNSEVIIGYDEIESIVRKDGPLKEFFK